MKKIALLVLALISCICCNLDDDQGTQFEFTGIAEIIVPQTLVALQKGDTLAIQVHYVNPSICHSFDKFITTGTANIPKITLLTKTDEIGCTIPDSTALSSATFNFIAGDASPSVLNFWQGEDDNGKEQFLRLEIPVIQAP